MSKALKVIAVVAGAVALVATGVGAFAAAGSKLAAVASKVAKIASVVAGVASAGAALTYKPPPARGSVAQVVIDPDPPTPYVMGEGLVGGVLRHDVAYGPTVNKVPNPYRFMVMVLSGGGPVQSVTPQVEQGGVSSYYYPEFLVPDYKLGTCPDTALVPHSLWSPAPGWGSDSKLSGKACIAWSLKFDKDGKRFASGVPQLGALVQGVRVYDPRLDSTLPGGAGGCTLGNEASYVYSANPALHAATYAYGRFQNGKKVLGVGLPGEAIDWANVAAWANLCDANGWTLFGVIYEPGDRWANLKDIALAGGAVPLVSGGVLSFHYAAPRVTLDTATDADLADGDMSVTAMASWRERINAVVPKYRSAEHNWEMIDAAKVTVASYVTEDGEEKAEVYPFNLVKNKDQAAQLAAYRLVDGRELQPIEITYGPRLFAYGPGDCLNLNHPELGLFGPFVILTRKFDPTTMSVSFTLISETPAKHAFALGRTGVAPPTPALGQSAGDRDNVAFSVSPPNATDGADIGVNLRLPTRVPTQAELITADGIAAGYYGQTAWGTYAAVSPTTMNTRTSRLLDADGSYDDIGTIRNRRLTRLQRNDGVTNVTEGMVITADGIAAGYYGQTAWGTYSGRSPGYLDLLARPGANALFNASFRLNWAGWSSGGLALSRDWRGNIVEPPSGTGGTFVATSQRPINSGNGVPVTLSAVFTGSATPLAFIFIDIEWRNGGNGALVGYSSSTANGCIIYNETVYKKLAVQPLTAPSATDGSGFVRGYVRVVSICDVAYSGGTRWVEQIKVETGSSATPFSDEATDSALYADGTWIDGLKPDEIGANKTETRIAAGFVGAGAGAYANKLSDLDAVAAAQLAAAYSGSTQTAGYGETLKRRIAVGGTLSLTGQVSVAAGGSSSGNVKARVEVSPFGEGSWSTVDTGSGVSVTPSEPGATSVTCTFTNTTGVEKMFEFRVVVVRTPSGAGGSVIASETYLTG